MSTFESVREIIGRFALSGVPVEVTVNSSGHINDTYRVTCREGERESAYILQRINEYVFRDVAGLMNNLIKVTSHVKTKVQGGDVIFDVIPTRGGEYLLRDDEGQPWRCLTAIANSYSEEVSQSPRQAREAGAIFGRFIRYLEDLDPSKLVETIPSFFASSPRFNALEEEIQLDRLGRARYASREIDYLLEYRKDSLLIEEAMRLRRVPLRVIHGDAKLNNVLFEVGGTTAISVVDLDTCMGGSCLFDFGDLIRNVSFSSAEDERNLSRVIVDTERARAAAEGFAEGTRGILAFEEIELLPRAPRAVAITLAVRFLSDYIAGDLYFKTSRPEQNLERCRVQIRIAEELKRAESALTIALAS